MTLTPNLPHPHRHRRTHEARPDGEIGTFTDDDLEAEENEFGTLDEEGSPPPSEHSNNSSYMHNAMSSMTATAMRMPPAPGMSAGHAGMPPPPMMAQHQLLQQQI